VLADKSDSLLPTYQHHILSRKNSKSTNSLSAQDSPRDLDKRIASLSDQSRGEIRNSSTTYVRTVQLIHNPFAFASPCPSIPFQLFHFNHCSHPIPFHSRSCHRHNFVSEAMNKSRKEKKRGKNRGKNKREKKTTLKF